MVALSGAHALGRCHADRSGWDGPWTNAPTTFSNLYFVELFENKWWVHAGLAPWPMLCIWVGPRCVELGGGAMRHAQHTC